MITSLFRHLFPVLLSVAILTASGCGELAQEGRAPADLVLRTGAVYTVSPERSWAQAIAIDDGRLVYVGSDEGIGAFIGEGTEIIDLGGKMVLPGFFDSHSHPPGAALTQAVDVSLSGQESLEGYLKAVQEYAESHPEKKAIRGRPWSNALFPPTGPRKEDLDKIVSDRIVSLTSGDGHSIWVNSKALEIAAITKDSPNPEGGVIEKDPETGEPTGTLRENARDLVRRHLPPYTLEEQREGLLDFQKTAAEYGVTTVHIASILPEFAGADSMNAIEAYRNLEESNQLTVRFRGSLRFPPDASLETIPGYVKTRAENTGPLFQTNAVKIFVDGVVEGSTAYLLEPYVHKPGYRGELLWDPEHLKEVCAALDKEGFQIHVHAIGDGAIHVTLNTFEHAQNVNGKRDSRHMITHLQLVAPEDKPRFGSLGVVGLPQPFWFRKGGFYEKIEAPYLGEERASKEYPMKSLIEAGAVMASSSDYSVTLRFSPLIGIEQGMTRAVEGSTDPEQILGFDERVSLEEMIASFTINGAYANFLEKETGSLEVGKKADLVVLDQNLFEIPVTEISETKVLMTLLEGKEVYRNPAFQVH